MSNNETTKDGEAAWNALRQPFPPETVGKLPRGGIQLDFVGHAAVTDRLNTAVGPNNWELVPYALSEDGSPLIRTRGRVAVMWAKLTVNGTTKICVGTCEASKYDLEKELIGDALRNGAMRFGVALDLWSKDELESTLEDPTLKNKPAAKKAVIAGTAAPSSHSVENDERTPSPTEPISNAQKQMIVGLLKNYGVLVENVPTVLSVLYNVDDPKSLTALEAKRLISQIRQNPPEIEPEVSI